MTTILTSSTKRSPARTLGVRALVALGLVAVLSTAAGCGSEPTPPQTGRVERGTVVTKVAASGSLTAIREKNLGFPKGGELKEVLVKVGDRVSAGQILARTDDFLLRQTLDQLQGQLNSQQALFGRLVNATTVDGTKSTLDQAQQILSSTQRLLDTQLSADSSAVDQARRQLDFNSFLLNKAQEQLRADQVSCASTGGIPYTPPPPSTGTGGNDPATPEGPDSSVGVGPAQAGLENPVQVGPASAGVPGAGPGGAGSGNGNPACNRIPQDQQAAVNARRQVMSDKTALETAQQKLNVDRASGQVSIDNARQSVVTAQNNLDAASSERPFNIEQQVALVASAQAQVAAAQRDVDETVLRAPVAGTVSVINGVPGEFVQPSANTSPLAPGTDAAIPGLEGSAANSSLSLGNAATGAQRPGGSQFLVLSEINTFQVVVPFEESDAAKVTPNQKVDVSFDAVPDLTRAGTVVAVSPSGSSISSVINYYVTVVLNETDPRLKDGQTAQARVITNQVEDVLTVPNSAIRKRGDQSSVIIIDGDGVEQQIRFQAGLVGDDRTQVISGLKEGQQVVLREGV
ncbi:MAG TPA: HlyD family efflux transporter periplasmic adaptor subunit [Pseudonocardiaceae bacterium]|nr:HlyD family efflux transporter periplasmic adaptor subunit [Pseudonocardiaceae bacterium]